LVLHKAETRQRSKWEHAFL